MDATELKKMFDQRDKDYSDSTTALLDVMNSTIQGVLAFLSLNQETAQGKFTWNNAQLVEDTVTLVAVVEYPPGSSFVTSEGKTIKVSENNADYFKRIIRLGVPVELAATGTKDDVVKFLQKVKAEADQIDDMGNEFVDAAVQAANGSPEPEFNVDELTKKQRESLEMFALISNATAFGLGKD